MTCKDCIHYEPCFSGGQSVWNNINQTKDDCCRHFKTDKTAKAEAYKEFAERFAVRFENEIDQKVEQFYFEEEHENFMAVNKVCAFVDNLLKEMIGE